jgi:hypothetical protein
MGEGIDLWQRLFERSFKVWLAAAVNLTISLEGSRDAAM